MIDARERSNNVTFPQAVYFPVSSSPVFFANTKSFFLCLLYFSEQRNVEDFFLMY